MGNRTSKAWQPHGGITEKRGSEPILATVAQRIYRFDPPPQQAGEPTPPPRSTELTVMDTALQSLSSRWMNDVLACDMERATKIDPLRVEFTGTFVAVFGEADEKGLGFRVKIDSKPVLYHPKNGEPQEMWPFDSSRYGKGRLFKFQVLADELPAGCHVMEITPEISSAVKTGQLRIESVCTTAITRND